MSGWQASLTQKLSSAVFVQAGMSTTASNQPGAGPRSLSSPSISKHHQLPPSQVLCSMWCLFGGNAWCKVMVPDGVVGPGHILETKKDWFEEQGCCKFMQLALQILSGHSLRKLFFILSAPPKPQLFPRTESLQCNISQVPPQSSCLSSLQATKGAPRSR